MERDRNSKILAIIALTVAVIGLSIGFAAFSQTLTIQSSADVKPDESEFTSNVKFVTDEGEDSGTVDATPVGATAEAATLSATEIQNIKVHFTKPGQSATYSFKVKNASPYDAYLRSVTFKNADGDGVGTTIKCKKVTHPEQEEKDALDEDVAAACTGIKVTVTVGSSPYTESDAAIKNHKLEKTSGEEDVEVKIEYAAGSGVTDGDFEVAIGDIELLYASRDNAA